MVHLAYRLYLFYISEKTCKWLEIKTRKNKVSAWLEGDTSPVIVTKLCEFWSIYSSLSFLCLQVRMLTRKYLQLWAAPTVVLCCLDAWSIIYLAHVPSVFHRKGMRHIFTKTTSWWPQNPKTQYAKNGSTPRIKIPGTNRYSVRS